jgi:sialidase-1
MKTNVSFLGVVATLAVVVTDGRAQPASALRKVEDITIYRNERFYSAFPSIVRRPDGELIVAFRRAPERRLLGETKYSHTDPNSYLVLTRSKDSGKSWSAPSIFYAHDFGGSQDPCLVQLNDGLLVCASYGWASISPEATAKMKQPMSVNSGKFVFLGGYLVRSRDGGATWGPTILPPHVETEGFFDPHGEPIRAYNRGAMTEGRDGRLYWVVAVNPPVKPARTENHLLISEDKGVTWKYSCPVAQDEKVTFNEASIYETPKGVLVAFMRTAGFNDHLCVARSTDGGKSFQTWRDTGWQGHPAHALRLPDNRVLLVYGYRHKPFGIRARVLDAECTNVANAPEIVLRDDGGMTDLGYPWSTMISDKRAMVVYYFNRDANAPRSIEGTIVEVN